MNKQYLDLFIAETSDNLQMLNKGLLDLEQNTSDINKVNEIFRSTHTIKGMAATMGYLNMAELTHKMEDLLSKFRDGNLYISEEAITVLLKCVDLLESMVNNLDEEKNLDISSEIELLQKCTLEFISNINIREIDKSSDIKLKDEIILNQKYKKGSKSVRVELERLDKFMNMVSELVIHRTRLEQLAREFKSQELSETLEQVARTTSDLQDLVMQIRMLPIDIVFSRFPRMIRDLSLELDKEINFIIEGANTELDRVVIDEIGEPLIHLLRNAVDHGIGTKEYRISNGKNAIGTIRLSAYQEGTKAIIKVEDDGKGLDYNKIKGKADELGINTKDMSKQELTNLIFMEGFSTSDEVTDISGRGVGMDAVKTKIMSLGGTIEVLSEMGIGTTFKIVLPLTLQIIQALLVKVSNETLAISLGFVDRVIQFTEDLVKRSNKEEYIFYEEKIIPLVRLSDKLNLSHISNSKKFVVIVNIGGELSGLLVDDLIGQNEIVIKPLGKLFENIKYYMGATILGNGLVTLILDVGVVACAK